MSEELPWSRAGFGPGMQVAGYRLEDRVGQGGMAVVFRAVDERLGRRVALKVMAPALAEDEGFRQRFIRESRSAAAVDDPHIIPVYEAGEENGVLYIAMRYVPGGDVGSLVRRQGRLSPAHAAAVISPIASALDAAHGAGLVHRDVKPANMLLDRRPGRPDHVYLSDFGLSKAWQGSAGLTGSGLFVGTLDYAAPEQIEGRALDGRTDQYALGCAAFQLLAGEPPFRRDEGLAVMYAQLSAPPPKLTGLRTELPPAVDQVLASALAKSPGDRYATCGEFADALRTALGLPPYGDHGGRALGRTATVLASAGPAASRELPGSTADASAGVQLAATRGPAARQPEPDPAGTGTSWSEPPARRGRRRLAAVIAVAAVLVSGGQERRSRCNHGTSRRQPGRDLRPARPGLPPSGPRVTPVLRLYRLRSSGSAPTRRACAQPRT